MVLLREILTLTSLVVFVTALPKGERESRGQYGGSWGGHHSYGGSYGGHGHQPYHHGGTGDWAHYPATTDMPQGQGEQVHHPYGDCHGYHPLGTDHEHHEHHHHHHHEGSGNCGHHPTTDKPQEQGQVEQVHPPYGGCQGYHPLGTDLEHLHHHAVIPPTSSTTSSTATTSITPSTATSLIPSTSTTPSSSSKTPPSTSTSTPIPTTPSTPITHSIPTTPSTPTTLTPTSPTPNPITTPMTTSGPTALGDPLVPFMEVSPPPLSPETSPPTVGDTAGPIVFTPEPSTAPLLPLEPDVEEAPLTFLPNRIVVQEAIEPQARRIN